MAHAVEVMKSFLKKMI